MTDKRLLAIELDAEWLQLIREAKKLGLNIEEVRKFIHNNCFIQKMANDC